MLARKITFEEAWDSSIVFLMDCELEMEIVSIVDQLVEAATHPAVSEGSPITVEGIYEFLRSETKALEVILKDIGLSEERLQRIVTLLRKLGRVEGVLEREWGIATIKGKIRSNPEFAMLIANLLVDGARDAELAQYIPRYYLDALNYRAFNGSTEASRRIRYETSLIGTRGGKMGYYVERKIKDRLAIIQEKHGVGFSAGKWAVVDTDIDAAIPTAEDPYVIIMSSFQETTSSGQTNKARDMQKIFERIRQFNSRNRQERAFVNFVDGGGWLARRTDFKRLVDECHYFLNFHHLDMLEDIVLKHVPEEYRQARR